MYIVNITKKTAPVPRVPLHLSSSPSYQILITSEKLGINFWNLVKFTENLFSNEKYLLTFRMVLDGTPFSKSRPLRKKKGRLVFNIIKILTLLLYIILLHSLSRFQIRNSFYCLGDSLAQNLSPLSKNLHYVIQEKSNKILMTSVRLMTPTKN